MSRVQDCSKMLSVDATTEVMLEHADGLAKSLKTYVGSIKGVMRHLEVKCLKFNIV